MASRIIPRTAAAAARRRIVANPSRRCASTAAHGHHDITKAEPIFNPAFAGASAVVFGGLVSLAIFHSPAFYLLSSDGKKSDHDSHGFSSSKRKDLEWEYKRMAGEGLPKSGEQPDPEDKSTNPAYNTGSSAGSPSVVAASSNSGSDADEGVADSVKASILSDAPQQAKQGEEEGTSPPTRQKSSLQQAFNNDAPKTAKKAEEDIARKRK
ncbi:hypothetical protein FRC04_002126 [Tulasnella sp. 424]|nr:hypothetical protein FRC04_002126 [Tulasnella sp. 424]